MEDQKNGITIRDGWVFGDRGSVMLGKIEVINTYSNSPEEQAVGRLTVQAGSKSIITLADYGDAEKLQADYLLLQSALPGENITEGKT